MSNNDNGIRTLRKSIFAYICITKYALVKYKHIHRQIKTKIMGLKALESYRAIKELELKI